MCSCWSRAAAFKSFKPLQKLNPATLRWNDSIGSERETLGGRCVFLVMASSYLYIEMEAAVAHWIHMRLPSCGPRFDSEPQHPRFFNLYLKFDEKMTKKAKRGQDRPIFKNVLLKDNVYLCYPWWLLVWGRRPKILGIITSFVVLVLLLIVSPKPYFFHPAGSTE